MYIMLKILTCCFYNKNNKLKRVESDCSIMSNMSTASTVDLQRRTPFINK